VFHGHHRRIVAGTIRRSSSVNSSASGGKLFGDSAHQFNRALNAPHHARQARLRLTRYCSF
jgi:hypothetical protein